LVQHRRRSRRLVVTADGSGVVSHVGARLFRDLAEQTTLTGQLSTILGGLCRPRARHDPGQVLTDLAVAIADGAECISDIATLADQPGLFGPVASDTTVWRLLEQLDSARLSEIAAARAAARETVWAQRAETTGAAFPPALTAGREVVELRIDLDASVVIAHSEKERSASTFKGTWGFHPMLATLDNTGEFLAAVLRPGNAGANDAADHIAVLDAAVAQIPDEYRYGVPILIRTDTAGATKAFLTHIVALREQGMSVDFSVGWRLGPAGNTMHAAIAAQPEWAWTPAVDGDGEPTGHAGVLELTGQLLALNRRALADYPSGTRIIVRRERPHPGAQLDLFEHATGWRYTAFATTTRVGQLAALDARHRAHARVEDRIRCAKDTGMGRFPSREFGINAAWLTAVMIAVDLIAWAQTIVLHDQPDLAKAEPKTLRYRLLHVAARITRGQRRLQLRIDRTWRWATVLAQAFHRVHGLPMPAT
jgi:Transposase DDE domain group 1